MIGTDDGIILVSNDCEPIGSAFGAGDGITLGIDERTELGYTYVSFDSSNEVKPDGSLLVE